MPNVSGTKHRPDDHKSWFAIRRSRRLGAASEMSRHRFLVSHEQLIGNELLLLGEERRHLKVRRIRLGEAVVVSDGAGAERAAVVSSLERDRALLRYTGAVQQAPLPSLRLTLAQAVLKADKLDLVVEKATELGAEAIVLLQSERVIGGLSATRLARLRRVAQSAAKQSQSARVPEISGPIPLASVCEATPAATHLLFWEESAIPLQQVVNGLVTPTHVVTIVGPEGGFSRAEVDAAVAAGCHVASLGSPILRAETAAIVALALVQFVWGAGPAARRD